MHNQFFHICVSLQALQAVPEAARRVSSILQELKGRWEEVQHCEGTLQALAGEAAAACHLGSSPR